MAINTTHPSHSVSHHSEGTAHSLAKLVHGPYTHFILLMGIHFVVMFAVMYTMVDTFADVFLNLNQVYMTGMMVAPMAVLMIMHMKMNRDKTKNTAIYVGSVILFVALFAFMRQQTFIGDRQFVRSMIPHHSGAVLMCEEASLTDPEIKDLCSKIIEGQKAEIEQMKRILSRLQ